MGKRKAAKKQAPKKALAPLASTFKCVFCHFEKSVNVKLDRQSMFGKLDCRNCGQNYQAPITNLSAAVDVYYDWVDACEEENAKRPPKQRAVRGPAPTQTAPVGLDFESRRRVAANEEAEDDAEGEDEDGDDDVRPARKETRREVVDDEDEDEDEDEDDVDEQTDKRRRVADPDDDEDDD